MANINFKTSYSQNQNLDNKIRDARDAFKNSLEKNKQLKSFSTEITFTNKDEYDLTKFVLEEVNPKTKKNEITNFLNIFFLEYLGG